MRPIILGTVALIALDSGFVYSQAPKQRINPDHPSGAFINKDFKPKAVPNVINFTLQRVRDFRYSSGNIDCPNCKDMFTARIAPPTPGAIITSVRWIARRPTSNNHWFRCQIEARCGRPEFSDPTNPRVDCIGKTACEVNRATDDGVPDYEDDIQMTYQ